MKFGFIRIIISLAATLTHLCVYSDPVEGSLAIPLLENAAVIDGELNEPQWKLAAKRELIYVTEPFENTISPVKTDVFIYEDGDTLFVAFVADDPEPDNIRAFYRDRDLIFGDDLVGLKLDTFNDSRLAYQFFVNPFGVQADLIENEMTGNESDAWNAIWESAGKITETGYVVEMALPLRIMNFNENDETKTWGAEFLRFYPREDELRISDMKRDRDNSCFLCQMGEVSGFETAKQSNNLAIVPTIVAGKSRSRDIYSTRDWEYDDNQEVGLDVNWGITPEFTLQATFNPDFSQVESDVAQLSINNTFALFFDEQRPFFTENADYFSSNLNLVYTRNIGSPDYGAKVTGRVDDHSIGVFLANDESTTFLVPGNLGSSVAVLDEESTNAAIRYRYDLSDDLSLGVVSTLRQAGDYHNYVNGADVRYLISETDTLRAQVVVSDTQYPTELFRDFCFDGQCADNEAFTEEALRTANAEAFSGLSYRVNYSHEERNWFFNAAHYANGEDFRADLGFVSQIDHNKTVVGGGYLWWSQTSWWNRLRLNGDWDITHNDNGELIEQEVEVFFSVRGDYQTFWEVGYVDRARVGLRLDSASLAIDGNTDRFDERQYRSYFEVQPNETVYFNVIASQGDAIDFANNRLGEQLLVESEVELNLGQHLFVGLYGLYNDFESNDAALFEAHLADLRLTYQFNTRQFVRLILAYSNIERNLENYNPNLAGRLDADAQDVGWQLLYSYKLNPLTKFFVGISDTRFNDDSLRRLTSAEQSVFMKFSYAWLQ
ncbi:carbohydrate binding family 9 domain-containing protein [Alteromonas oceanisediminis]|uniref:carbohydrate binding family 9 domain-containing protein n=1 Tax=Alteromonas oceanisediminis TaxID=2836180 RepID=UPI001BD9EB59|nr:carbohydrate binding family 9 domain-containing protein [Alteromonas oceanisediminis]MBT0586909.1 carbohydrate binding family 9 domain-containing protein [Alteromonas oceanisediminis]